MNDCGTAEIRRRSIPAALFKSQCSPQAGTVSVKVAAARARRERMQKGAATRGPQGRGEMFVKAGANR
jgi:hypothetical protein